MINIHFNLSSLIRSSISSSPCPSYFSVKFRAKYAYTVIPESEEKYSTVRKTRNFNSSTNSSVFSVKWDAAWQFIHRPHLPSLYRHAVYVYRARQGVRRQRFTLAFAVSFVARGLSRIVEKSLTRLSGVIRAQTSVYYPGRNLPNKI